MTETKLPALWIEIREDGVVFQSVKKSQPANLEGYFGVWRPYIPAERIREFIES